MKIQVNLRELDLREVDKRLDGPTDKQRNRITKHFSIRHSKSMCWDVLIKI